MHQDEDDRGRSMQMLEKREGKRSKNDTNRTPNVHSFRIATETGEADAPRKRTMEEDHQSAFLKSITTIAQIEFRPLVT